LPEPRLNGDIVLEDVLGFEPDSNEYANPHSSIEDISQLLYAAQGITHFPFRSVPSAGGTYPLDVFVLANSLSQIGILGLNHFKPFDHSMTQSSNIEYLKLTLTLNNSSVKVDVNSTLFAFIITAEFSRTTEKYGNRGIDYVELEIGHLIQNVRIQARALQYQMIEVYDFAEEITKETFNLEFEPMVILFFKRYETTNSFVSKINLHDTNSLDLSQKSVSVEDAIYNRKSIRDYSDKPMPKSKLTSLIDYSFYRRDPFTNNLVFPSIPGNLPIDLVLSVTNVNGLNDGLFNFDYHTRDYDLISNDPRRTEIYERSLEQQWVLDAQVVLIFIINQTKLQRSQYDLAIHSTLGNFELGTIAQNIYLEAYSLTLGAVVVGAFSDNGIRDAVFASQEMLPLYVIPVGVVPEGFYQSISFLSIEWFESIFAWIAIIFIYFSCLIMTPPLKRGLRRGTKWFHLVLGIFGILSGIAHVMLYHGGLYLVSKPNSDRIVNLVKSVMFSFPTTGTNSQFETGLNLARISVWTILVFSTLGLISVVKSSNKVVKQYLIPLHKYIGYAFIILIGLHVLMNSYWLPVFGFLIYLIIIVATVLYIVLHNWLKISKFIHTKEIKDIDS
jgi:SagB-type dehydrogenase family enzyme